MINYNNLCELTIHSQKEFDDIPRDFGGRIYIIDTVERIIINKRFYRRVIVRQNSIVEARKNSTIEAWENSMVGAWENSTVEARENSIVEAWGNSAIEARENSTIIAWESSRVVAWENSTVEAWGNSSIKVRENSAVQARGSSTIEAWENSMVEVYDDSTVEARGNVQVVGMFPNKKIKVDDNARAVLMPSNVYEFMKFYGIKRTKQYAIFYKAYRKASLKFRSSSNRDIASAKGKTINHRSDCDSADNNKHSVHITHLDHALSHGRDWEDLAILEVMVPINKIVMSSYRNKELRTSECRVIREVPLRECGIYGQIIEKRK